MTPAPRPAGRNGMLICRRVTLVLRSAEESAMAAEGPRPPRGRHATGPAPAKCSAKRGSQESRRRPPPRGREGARAEEAEQPAAEGGRGSAAPPRGTGAARRRGALSSGAGAQRRPAERAPEQRRTPAEPSGMDGGDEDSRPGGCHIIKLIEWQGGSAPLTPAPQPARRNGMLIGRRVTVVPRSAEESAPSAVPRGEARKVAAARLRGTRPHSGAAASPAERVPEQRRPAEPSSSARAQRDGCR